MNWHSVSKMIPIQWNSFNSNCYTINDNNPKRYSPGSRKYVSLKVFIQLNSVHSCGKPIRFYVFIFMLLLLLLSRFGRVGLCATPETAAYEAPPSLGFSRQEHWSGLPFPSPMHQSWQVKVKSLSCVRLFTTPWTAAYQAPPSMGFSRQEYCSGVPSPSP